MRCVACGTEVGDPQQYCTKCGAFLGIGSKASPRVEVKHPLPPILRFDRIVGQKRAVERLAAICQFSRARGVAAEHLLLTGPDGSGKRTVAGVLAGECGVAIHVLDASTIERKADFTAVVMCLDSRDVLLVQNIGALPGYLRKIFLDALQHERIDLVIGQGAGARVHPFQLSRFTCIATAYRESECPPELRDAFTLTIPFEPYSLSELEALASLISSKVGVAIDSGAAKLIAQVSGGLPHRIEIMVQRLARLNPANVSEKDAADILSTYGVRGATDRVSEPYGDLQNLTGTEFEDLIAALLARLGFRTQTTKASGDGGVDMVAELDRPLVGGTYLIQCKRFAPSALVGAPIVREFQGAISARPKAVKGVLITTSGFTAQARDFAHDVGIELIDGERLRELLAGRSEGSQRKNVEPLSSPRMAREKPFLF